MRQCSRCGKEKAITEFYRAGRYQRTHRYSCKECDRANARDRRKPEAILRKMQKQTRAEVIVRLRRQGSSQAAIARVIGVTVPTVRTALRSDACK